MSGRLFAAVVALGAAAAGVAAYHKYKKQKQEEQVVLEFDLSVEDEQELDELASSAEVCAASTVEAAQNEEEQVAQSDEARGEPAEADIADEPLD